MHKFALIEFLTREARRDADGVMLLFDAEEEAQAAAVTFERKGIRITVLCVIVDGQRVMSVPRAEYVWKLES